MFSRGVQLRGEAEERAGRERPRAIVATTILFLSICSHSSEIKISRGYNEWRVVFAIVPSKRKTGAAGAAGRWLGYTPAAMNGMTNGLTREGAACGR
jgi:hypothetical protein